MKYKITGRSRCTSDATISFGFDFVECDCYQNERGWLFFGNVKPAPGLTKLNKSILDYVDTLVTMGADSVCVIPD